MKDHKSLPATLPNIAEICDGFTESLRLYEEASTAIEKADAALKAARAEIERVTPGAQFHSRQDAHEVDEFENAVQLPNRKRFLRTARKLLNVRCWHYVVDRCGLERLMDSQARKELERALQYVPDSRHDRDELITGSEDLPGPPPFTEENVKATLAKFAAESGMIWRRGIANVFSSLDRRFRSHDGFRIGSRVILSYFVNSYGRIDTYGRTADLIRDIERTFLVLDGKNPQHTASTLTWRVGEERSAMGIHSEGQSEHQTEYMKVRVFKNGNAHLWFTRDDLVEKVNQELAAYYGEVIGDGNTKEPDPLESRAVDHARNFGFYPTPPSLAEQIARLPLRRDEEPMRLLEPSAGTGNLIRAVQAIAPQHQWDAIEVQPKLAAELDKLGCRSVLRMDFLKTCPDIVGPYDGILMNPPFDRERDIDHVTHALKFLKPGGWLLSIMSAGTEFRETQKAAAFRKLLDDRKGWMIDLPAGSFSEVGTYVNTVLVGIGMRKPYENFR